jgi:hypothetical protein
MTKTVEDAVDFLLGLSANYNTMPRRDTPRLSMRDREVLNSIRTQSWWNSQPITEKQQALVNRIVGKYLMLLKLHQWPVDDLIQPQWRTPVTKSVSATSWILDYDADRDQFAIAFPYEKNLHSLLNYLSRDEVVFVDRLEYIKDSEASYWRLQNGLQARRLINYLLMRYNWYYETGVKQAAGVTEDFQEPVASYVNGSWRLLYAADSLAARVSDIAQSDLTLVQQAFWISETGVILDHTVRNALRPWLTANQTAMLCDSQPTVKIDQVPDLIRLIDLVAHRPIYVVINRYDATFTTDLEKMSDVQCVKSTDRLPQRADMIPWVIHYQSVVQSPWCSSGVVKQVLISKV